MHPHSTMYEQHRGMYPLCEECWAMLDAQRRLPYYKALLDRWDGLDDEDSPIPSWATVRRSVLEEDASNVAPKSHVNSIRASSSGDDLIYRTL